MNKIIISLLGILGVIAIGIFFFGGWIWGTYNALVTQREVVATSWSNVQTDYQRRFDLIPGLVNSVKGIMGQERAVFEAIADARTKYAGSSAGSESKIQATSQMEGALSRLLVVMENYPTLKSNEQVQALMDELAGTENRIQVSRQRYNEQVKIYNIKIKVFPTSILAGLFGFTEKALFESVSGSEQAVPVDLKI
jgi:LemA protein